MLASLCHSLFCLDNRFGHIKSELPPPQQGAWLFLIFVRARFPYFTISILLHHSRLKMFAIFYKRFTKMLTKLVNVQKKSLQMLTSFQIRSSPNVQQKLTSLTNFTLLIVKCFQILAETNIANVL